MQPYTKVSADHVLAAFNCYGGVPRYVFDNTTESLTRLRSALRSVQPRTVRCVHCSHFVATMMDDDHVGMCGVDRRNTEGWARQLPS